MGTLPEIELADEFVQRFWFDELDHDDTEVPRMQDLLDWIHDRHPAAIFIADQIYRQVKHLYFP